MSRTTMPRLTRPDVPDLRTEAKTSSRVLPAILFLIGGAALLTLVLWLLVALVPAPIHARAVALDRAIFFWLRGQGSEVLDRAAVEVTFLGARLVGGVMVLAITAFLWAMRERLAALFLWTSFFGSLALTTLLKVVFARPRPDPELWRVAYATDWSFPSGHAVNAIVVYGGLYWVIHRLALPRPIRIAAFVIAALVVLLIAASRPYVGVHYPLDVLAGLLVGAGWLILCAIAWRMVAARTGRRHVGPH